MNMKKFLGVAIAVVLMLSQQSADAFYLKDASGKYVAIKYIKLTFSGFNDYSFQFSTDVNKKDAASFWLSSGTLKTSGSNQGLNEDVSVNPDNSLTFWSSSNGKWVRSGNTLTCSGSSVSYTIEE